jgi:hypothetical protein
MKVRLAVVVLLAITAAAQIQDKPKVIDKKFFVVSAFSASALAFDAYTTAARKTGCVEGGEPWLLGTNPTPGKIAAVSVGEFALGEGLTYLLKRSHNRLLNYLWPAPITARGAIHLYAGIHNYQSACQ